MPEFRGFPSGKVRLTPVPGPFFQELLPRIDDLDELKVTLYAFWWLDHREGKFRYFKADDLLQDEVLKAGFGENARTRLETGLGRAVERGTFLRAEIRRDDQVQSVYFLNSPRGRAAVQAIASGAWLPSDDEGRPLQMPSEPINIFRLYEEHIGPLTPMIADTLRDAEGTYPTSWIEEAIRIAVENNVRRWRYVEAILRSWREEGRDERKTRGDPEEDRKRYTRGRFSEFIEH